MKTWPRIPIDQCRHDADQMDSACGTVNVVAPPGHVVDPPTEAATSSPAMSFLKRVAAAVLWFALGVATGAVLVA